MAITGQSGVGALIGHSLNALPGYSTLGHNITSPNVNYTGAANPGGGFTTWGTGAAQSTPSSSSYDTSAGGGGGSAPDPYAAYGGQSAYNSLVSGFDTQHQNLLSSAFENATSKAGSYYNGQGGVLDFLDAQRQGQNKVNNDAIQNELAKQQGTQGVLASVGRGIKSGGVMLANKNAGNSSAAQGLADAYGQYGRQQLSGVGNQYAQGQNGIQQEQSSLDLARTQGVRHLEDSKNQIVNSIVADTQSKLAALDAQIANANLPNRIAIDQEKERVRTDALGKLQAFDQQLQQGIAGINPSSMDQNRIQANQMAQAGQAPADAFNFTSQIPGQFQNTGPSPAPLPLFSLPKGKDSTAVAQPA